MYVIKNALRCISRAKGRSILIGIIVLVISVSACLGLSIRQAAENARESTLEGLSVTATVSFDRSSAMGNFAPGAEGGHPEGGFNREDFSSMMGGLSSLTLEEYQKYAATESVKDFYYTVSASLNGTDSFAAVENTSSSSGGMGGGRFPGIQGGASKGDLSITGYSKDAAMTEFINGTAVIESGKVFDEGTALPECIISSELATYNSISVGDTVTVANPVYENETYTLTVVGIYKSTENNSFDFGKDASSDPANRIYMSYTALKSILDASSANSVTVTDESGRSSSSALKGTLVPTYTFASVDDYYVFEAEVRELGLDDSYTVSSSDINAYESSLVPLESLSKMAGYFLIVILAIGAVILVVLNIFSVRERKYEIGVLTAMGMKKGTVALQFLCEILVITLVTVTLGLGIGAVSSVPVTNTLLETQIESQNDRISDLDKGFGRENGGMPQRPSDEALPDGMPEMPDDGDRGGFFGGAANYIAEVDSAMDLTVVLQMLGIAVLLTLAAGAASVLFVMRYEPLKILSNRD